MPEANAAGAASFSRAASRAIPHAAAQPMARDFLRRRAGDKLDARGKQALIEQLKLAFPPAQRLEFRVSGVGCRGNRGRFVTR
jgi:hypothetical protein